MLLSILTDSGLRSTFTWSPSSKPSGTLFCINRGMERFMFSDLGPFCHRSSCLRESMNVKRSFRRFVLSNGTHSPAYIHIHKPSMSSLTAWDSTESLSWVVFSVLPPFSEFWPTWSGLCQRFFWIRGMMSSLGFSLGFELHQNTKLERCQAGPFQNNTLRC